MILLIDVGNSRIKWCLLNEQHLGPIHALAHADSHQLFTDWARLSPPQRIFISQVGAPSSWHETQQWLQQHWPLVTIDFPQSQAQQLGVSNAYSQPEKLGIDRWLALIAAHHEYRETVCVADCGTALTIDILDAQGQHLGGLIAPGLNLMRRALAHNTAQLPEVCCNIAQLQPASTTTQAIASGSLLAVVGCIEATLNRQSQTMRLILTGGDAAQVAQALSSTIELTVDPELVFKGLALISQQRPTC